jgi:RES domain-containing protein
LRLWRITTRKWALDTACEGARLHGGRWNPIGHAALYAGATIEICALEKFVHLGTAPHPPLVLVAVDLPDDAALILRPEIATLPPAWSDLPVSAQAQAFGRQWLDAGRQLVLLVPSAIIPESTNALINPAHPAYREMQLTIVREFTFDARMFRI